jgi:alpha-tubulin suppressor-like RCC1 family protein
VTKPVVDQLALGWFHSCARLGDGTVKCWGDNGVGQLGDGTTTNSSTPVAVQGLSGAVEIAAGGLHSCARLGDGTVKCWGNNFSGELGDVTGTYSSSTPVVVQGLSGAVEIAAGNWHSCARLGDGTVKCWGGNSDGQLGDGTDTISPTPVVVQGLP